MLSLSLAHLLKHTGLSLVLNAVLQSGFYRMLEKQARVYKLCKWKLITVFLEVKKKGKVLFLFSECFTTERK